MSRVRNGAECPLVEVVKFLDESGCAMIQKTLVSARSEQPFHHQSAVERRDAVALLVRPETVFGFAEQIVLQIRVRCRLQNQSVVGDRSVVYAVFERRTSVGERSNETNGERRGSKSCRRRNVTDRGR